MTEDGVDQMDPPSPKVVAALLREARSVSRRAYAVRTDLPPDHDKLMATRNQPAAVRRVRSPGQARVG